METKRWISHSISASIFDNIDTRQYLSDYDLHFIIIFEREL